MRVGRHKSRFLGGEAKSTQYDAIVVGSGHNGLTCACYLAKVGLEVLTLERYSDVGQTLTEERTLLGFRSDVHASGYQLANLSPVPGTRAGEARPLAHRAGHNVRPRLPRPRGAGRQQGPSKDRREHLTVLEIGRRDLAQTRRALPSCKREERRLALLAAGGAEVAWLFGTVLQDVNNNLVKGGMHHVSLALAGHLRSLGVRSGRSPGWRRS